MHSKGKHPLSAYFVAWTIELGSIRKNIPRHLERANKRHKLCVATALVDGHLAGRFGTAPTPNGMYATFVGDGLPDVPDTRTKIKKIMRDN